MNNKKRIAIVYTWRDNKGKAGIWVDKMIRKNFGLEVDPKIDHRDFIPGKLLDFLMTDHIQKADGVVIVLTENIHDSNAVYEYKLANGLQKEFIEIKMDPNVDPYFKDNLYIDLSRLKKNKREREFVENFDKFLQNIKNKNPLPGTKRGLLKSLFSELKNRIGSSSMESYIKRKYGEMIVVDLENDNQNEIIFTPRNTRSDFEETYFIKLHTGRYIEKPHISDCESENLEIGRAFSVIDLNKQLFSHPIDGFRIGNPMDYDQTLEFCFKEFFLDKIDAIIDRG